MRSMTGHGRGVAQVDGRRITIEIRSVNHRFLDFKVRGTGLDASLEERIVQAIRRVAERGAFTITVRDEGVLSRARVRVDLQAAQRAQEALNQLRDAVGSDEAVPLSLIAQQPGVVLSSGEEPETEEQWRLVSPAVERALEQLSAMRAREGEALGGDLTARLGRLEALGSDVGALAAEAPEDWRRRLSERLTRLLHAQSPTVPLDESRLHTEVAVLADRLDVTEELVRLKSHIGQARVLLGQTGAVGRRLDFLAQELAREVNTIGAKSQSAEIARLVVEAKAELEKIREQIQNVE